LGCAGRRKIEEVSFVDVPVDRERELHGAAGTGGAVVVQRHVANHRQVAQQRVVIDLVDRDDLLCLHQVAGGIAEADCADLGGRKRVRQQDDLARPIQGKPVSE
jgi:hypothetical protein